MLLVHKPQSANGCFHSRCVGRSVEPSYDQFVFRFVCPHCALDCITSFKQHLLNPVFSRFVVEKLLCPCIAKVLSACKAHRRLAGAIASDNWATENALNPSQRRQNCPLPILRHYIVCRFAQGVQQEHTMLMLRARASLARKAQSAVAANRSEQPKATGSTT